MSKRPPITERMKWQALLFHFGARCARCGKMILITDKIEWDHSHPLGLGGPHHYTNIKPLHIDCHLFKTSGTKATSAGSDIHKIAKAKRIAKGKMAVTRDTNGTFHCQPCKGTYIVGFSVKACPVCGWSAPTRKLQSRPFLKVSER